MKALTKVKPWYTTDVCEQTQRIIDDVRKLSGRYSCHHRLDCCTAWVYAEDNREYEIADKFLLSYSTIVAYYSAATNILYVDGRYSATTDKHVRKFWHEMGCPSISRTYVPSSKVVFDSYDPRYQIRKLSTGYYLYR